MSSKYFSFRLINLAEHNAILSLIRQELILRLSRPSVVHHKNNERSMFFWQTETGLRSRAYQTTSDASVTELYTWIWLSELGMKPQHKEIERFKMAVCIYQHLNSRKTSFTEHFSPLCISPLTEEIIRRKHSKK